MIFSILVLLGSIYHNSEDMTFAWIWSMPIDFFALMVFVGLKIGGVI